MIVIGVLAIPFIFYFNKTDFSAQRNDQFYTLYDRNVSMVEAQRHIRLYPLAIALGLYRFTQDLTVGVSDRNNQNELYSTFAINLIVLRHEAERLGLRSTPAEIAEFVRQMQPFRGPSGFDRQKYDEFVQNALSPYGLSETQLEELVGDELALTQIKKLVAAGVTVPESESKTAFEHYYGRVTVNVMRLQPGEFEKDIKVTDDDIGKYYESHKAALKTEEKRKIEFVSLALTEEQKKLKDKARIDVLQQLANRAQELSQALQEKGAEFHQVAAKFQLPVEATGEFTAVSPDPKLKDPTLAAVAFQLTKQEPNSEVVEGADGYHVLRLAGMTESRPLTLEEAKPKIVEAIKKSRAREMMASKGARISHDLREGLKAGEPLNFTLEKVNAKAEKLEPFILAEDYDPNNPPKDDKKKPADFAAIRNAAASLDPGGVSDFLPWEEGGLVVYLEKEEPPDPVKSKESKAGFEARLLNRKKDIVFVEWLIERQNEAGVRRGKG